MTPKKLDIVHVDKTQYLNYQKKAEEFYRAMLHAEKDAHWNAVGLNAVHSAISSSDALLVKFSGRRSISNDHMVAVDIMRQNLKLKDMSDKINTLKRILAKKSLVEYDSILFTRNNAMDIMKQAERFYLWARGELLK